LGKKSRAPHQWATRTEHRVPGQIPPLLNAYKGQVWPGRQQACAYCQRDDVPLTRDHIIPRRHGGPDVPVNIAAACEECNQAKSGIVPLGVKIQWTDRWDDPTPQPDGLANQGGYVLLVDWPLLRSEVRNFVLQPASRARRLRGGFGERGSATDAAVRRGNRERALVRNRPWLNVTRDGGEEYTTYHRPVR
jgi:hypothetical protein